MLSIGNRSVGMLSLHKGLGLVHWKTRSLLGRHLVGTSRVVFSCIGPEIGSRSHVHALIALANVPGAVLSWEWRWCYGILVP